MAEFWYNFEPVGTSRGFVTKFHGNDETNYELSDSQLNMIYAFMETQQRALQNFLKGIVE